MSEHEFESAFFENFPYLESSIRLAKKNGFIPRYIHNTDSSCKVSFYRAERLKSKDAKTPDFYFSLTEASSLVGTREFPFFKFKKTHLNVYVYSYIDKIKTTNSFDFKEVDGKKTPSVCFQIFFQPC
jgi:hypothetical protein